VLFDCTYVKYVISLLICDAFRCVFKPCFMFSCVVLPGQSRGILLSPRAEQSHIISSSINDTLHNLDSKHKAWLKHTTKSVTNKESISYLAHSLDIPRLISYLSWTVLDRSFKHNTCLHNWRSHWNVRKCVYCLTWNWKFWYRL
jgi:hypothetical protein